MGCTSGGVLDEKVILLFKNMDITGDDEGIQLFQDDTIAAICKKEAGNESSLGSKTSLGINKNGLFIGGLDYHTNYEPVSDGNGSKITTIYMTVLREARSYVDAIRLINILFKHEKVNVPDMLVLGGMEGGIFKIGLVQYDPSLSEPWSVVSNDKSYLVSTNYCLSQPKPSTPEQDPDSYQRLETARRMLKEDSSLKGVQEMLKDHTHGPGQSSICRHREWIPHKEKRRYFKGMYNTAASVVFEINIQTGMMGSYFVIGSNPCEAPYQKIELSSFNLNNR